MHQGLKFKSCDWRKKKKKNGNPNQSNCIFSECHKVKRKKLD